MAFDMFGLLPDPDEAYDNAPQVPVNTANLERMRKKLVGLSDARQNSMREDYQSALNQSANQATQNVKNSTRNASTAIAQNDRISDNRMNNTFRGERSIEKADLEAERVGEEMFNQEYARVDEKRAQNKITRELAREKADNARKAGLANIGGKIVGAGLSTVMGPAGQEVGDLIGGGVANAVTDTAKVNSLQQRANNFDSEDTLAMDSEPIATSLPDNELMAEDISDVGVGFGSYDVAQGDTLGGIAQYHGTTIDKILEYNPEISDPDSISVGQTLRLNPRDTPSKAYAGNNISGPTGEDVEEMGNFLSDINFSF